MLASAHPIRQSPEDEMRESYARILEAAKESRNPRRAYALIYSRFIVETSEPGNPDKPGIRLPNPHAAGLADKTMYRDRGRAFVRLPELERDDIVIKLYRMLQRITPGFTSDLNSVPKWLVLFFPWPKKFLELRLPGLIHDWFYHVSRTFGLWVYAGFRRAVDRLYREQNLELGSFSPWFVKPAYWAVGNVRWSAVRLRGGAPGRFRPEESAA